MKPTILALCSCLTALPVGAQSTASRAVPASPRDTAKASAASDSSTAATTPETDDDGVPLGVQYGAASGALRYPGGRSEQSLAGVLRWVPVRWFHLTTTATAIHASTPASPAIPPTSRGGLVDLPVEATFTHAMHARFAPTVSVGFGVTLPVGDSASGFGTGRLGYSATAAFGFAPTDQVWVHVGTGRTLSGASAQSAFSSGSGWGDVSAGYSLTDRLSINGGYSTDIGAVDPTIGRSASVNGGFALGLQGPLTLNMTTSHGLGGAAPSWSVAMGIGTAFPYLGHLDASDQLRRSFGGGPHGLGVGGTTILPGRGRHP